MKNYFLLLCLLFIVVSAAAGDGLKKKRIPFDEWPQVRFKQTRLLFASTPALSGQGFAGARPEEFERTLIFFPVIAENVYFSNRDFGFGPVVRDIAVYYLDKDFNVIRKDLMKKVNGDSYPPPGAVMAVEGLPEELKASALVPGGSLKKTGEKMENMKKVEINEAPAAVGPYSQAVVANGLVFASGQIALDPKTGVLVGDDISAQTGQVIANLSAVLKAAGTGLEHVVNATVYLTNMGDFAAMNAVYEKNFTGQPARATVGVAALPKGALVEIECVAVLP